MTEAQTQEIIAVLQAEYPQSFSQLDEKMITLKLRLWAKEFEHDDYRVVLAAVRAIIGGSNREFAPNIGIIREKINDFRAQSEMTETEAWDYVAKACRNGCYGYVEEFAKLPPTVQRAVGSANQIREWSMMDSDTLQSVVASNFMRSYRTTAQREKELAKIPANVLEVLQGAVKPMIESGGENNEK